MEKGTKNGNEKTNGKTNGGNGKMMPVFFLDFMEALLVVIWIIDFFVVYGTFYPEITHSQIVGLVVTAVIMFLLVIPFSWMAWVVFFIGFAYAFFWGFKPWTWAKESEAKLEEEMGA